MLAIKFEKNKYMLKQWLILLS